MRILRGEQRVTVGDDRGITGVAEGVELTTPWTTQATGIVQLYLSSGSKLVVQEQTGKELEIIFLEWFILGSQTVLLLVVQTLSIHLPVLAAQTCHNTQFTDVRSDGSIEGMGVYVVDKAVEKRGFLNLVGSLPVLRVYPRLLRSILMRETAIIACFELPSVRYLVLVFEFGLPRTVIDVQGTVLPTIAVVAVILGIEECILIEIVVIALPTAPGEISSEFVLLTELMGIAQFTMEHVVLAIYSGGAPQYIGRFGIANDAIVVGLFAEIIVIAEHRHT